MKAPVHEQIRDGVTGIHVSKKVDGEWQKPERVVLQDSGKLALDGAEFAQGNTMGFVSAREGYTGLHWFTARLKDGRWGDWDNADFNPEYQVGEFHIAADGEELYFHSSRGGGRGKLHIWVSKRANGEWQEPENVEAVNSAHVDGWPTITEDGKHLGFTRHIWAPEVYRSNNVNGKWQKPERMFSDFAGEPAVDNKCSGLDGIGQFPIGC